MRAKISYLFFKEKFEDLFKTINKHRKTFKGLYIYAVDGQETVIPVSEEILAKGYRGKKRLFKTETYYPRMYLSQAFDVVNEITMQLSFSTTRHENRDALNFIKMSEKNSLILYDRAYICKSLLNAHFDRKNYFIFRCQCGSTFKNIINFYASKKRKGTWLYEGIEIRLVKIKNPQTQQDVVLATNLPENLFSLKQLGELYTRRWSIETAFRDSVTQGLEHWHGKSENSLLQEFYTRQWLLNWTRLQILCEMGPQKKWLNKKYKKPNLKLLVAVMIESLSNILIKNYNLVLARIRNLIRRTLQSREHLKRSYGRLRRYSVKAFLLNNVVPHRPKP